MASISERKPRRAESSDNGHSAVRDQYLRVKASIPARCSSSAWATSTRCSTRTPRLVARELEIDADAGATGGAARSTPDGRRAAPRGGGLHRAADRQGLPRGGLRAGQRSGALEGAGRARGGARRHAGHGGRPGDAGRQAQQLSRRRRRRARRPWASPMPTSPPASSPARSSPRADPEAALLQELARVQPAELLVEATEAPSLRSGRRPADCGRQGDESER